MAWIKDKFDSWSFTRYSDYDRCPAFAKYKHLMKLDQGPKNPAMQRGADVADHTDAWFKGKRRAMPAELKPLAPLYRALKKDKTVQAEANWGFTREWEPCAPTDWNRCWLRVKVDILTTANGAKVLNLYDSKTGKFSDYAVAGYEMQLNLYAAAGTVVFPTAQTINTQLLFSDLGRVHPQQGPKVYTRNEAQAEIKAWEKRVKPMFNDKRFAPKPGNHCRWCPFSKNYSYVDATTGKRVARPGPCKF